jgi:hypothetical protein
VHGFTLKQLGRNTTAWRSALMSCASLSDIQHRSCQ